MKLRYRFIDNSSRHNHMHVILRIYYIYLAQFVYIVILYMSMYFIIAFNLISHGKLYDMCTNFIN